MSYPPPGGTPDPYQPQQPYGQPSYDPTAPYQQDPYTAPASGQPFGTPSSGQPYGAQQQPYAQPYGAPGYGPGYQNAGTNVMAILALVFAFVFAPAAIVLGHVAKKQIRQTGEQGEGLATAGLWLGYIFTGLSLALCAVYAVIIAFTVNGSSSTY